MAISEPSVKKGIATWLKAMRAWFFMPVQTGMGVGGIHDFISCVPVVITQEMVGKRLGLFVSVEAKEGGMVAKLRSLHARGRTAHAHLAKDGVFISNRPLQSWQADEIHEASGKAFIADDAEQLALDFAAWFDELHK